MKKEIHNELYDLNSSLVRNENIRIYKPGDDYFDKMQAEVFVKMNEHKQKRTIFKLNSIKVSGIAASVLILISALALINNEKNLTNEIAQVDAYHYLNENIDKIDESTLIQYIEESQLVQEDESFPDNSSIEAYLEENPENYEDLDIETLF
jgi:uncharacterized membrane protein YvbJ